MRFEGLPQLVQLANVGLGRHAHARSRTRTRFEQAVFLEALERVGDRYNTHPKLAREATPGDRRPWPKLPAKYFLAHRGIRLGREGSRTADPPFRHWQATDSQTSPPRVKLICQRTGYSFASFLLGYPNQ